MNFNQVLQAEREAERAFRAARIFADAPTREALARAELILGEVRHAASCIEDANADGRLNEALPAITRRLMTMASNYDVGFGRQDEALAALREIAQMTMHHDALTLHNIRAHARAAIAKAEA